MTCECTPLIDKEAVIIVDDDLDQPKRRSATRWQGFRHWMAIAGPGLVVMLADTDAGCLITAGQSGATWGFTLITLQLILIPIVFLTQDLTVLLGIFTQQGQVGLIKDTYGKAWGAVACGAVLLTCAGALVSELSGVVGVGELFGVPRAVSAALAVVFLLAVACTGSYRRVERLAIAIGLFQLVFVVTMFQAQPSWEDVLQQMAHPPLKAEFLYLFAANIGAVVMPWMVFYQQSAVVERRLSVSDLKYSRIDTAVGACLTQLVMISTLATTAATSWDGRLPGQTSLTTVRDFSDAVTVHLGVTAGRLLFSLGLLGGALVGAIVVSLTAVWSIGELADFKRSKESGLAESRWFYVAYTLVLLLGTALCLSPIDVISLNVFIQVFNCVLIPFVLGVLFHLSCTALPPEYALRGPRRLAIGLLFLLLSVASILAVAVGAQG